MANLKLIEKHYRENQKAEVLKTELMEYQQLSEAAEQMEASLEEFCTAIEDFGLACAGDVSQDERVIYCSAQNYTPQQLLQQAHQTSDALEQTLSEMVAAKGRVLSKILARTQNVEEYEAIRYAFVDVHDALRKLKADFKQMQS